ncbi:MAG: indole-3-glycerol-phosphate synthase [Thaumarchaeota archaeon]|nr:indole-3-glycerol-phosphate synthase [Nitrososphaerota archaeon]
MLQANDDFIATLAESARKTISEGYYDVQDAGLPARSLRNSLLTAKGMPLITEVKFRSPAEGLLRKSTDVREIALKYQRGGAAGISVLTEPKHFEGRLEYLTAVKRSVEIPVLMKDIVVDPVQIDAARKVGADAILLMAIIFKARLSNFGLEKMIEHAHERGLEVLLETHSENEYLESLNSQADIIGINNRNLKTLEVSLDTSRELLRKHSHPKTVICESGFSKTSELVELRSLGADGFLVGSALMKSSDIEKTVRELVGAT